MSKKKKNIRRKKSNNLLKGMAAAGAVVGGGTIFAGNNAVYAAELGSESGSTENLDGIGSQSVSESVSESVRPTNSQASDQAQGRNFARTENSFAQNTLGNNVATVSDETQGDDDASNNENTNKESESVSVSVSESESVSVSVSDSESLVNSKSVSNSKATSNEFGDLINGLFSGDKKVSAANNTTPNSKGSEALTANSESVDPETSMKIYFSESESLSNSLTLKYGSEIANETLHDNAYIVKNNGLIEEGVLVKDGSDYLFTYYYKGTKMQTKIYGNHVDFDETGNAKISWNGYYIKDDGTIELTSQVEDINVNSGNKTFITITENNEEKYVFAVKEKIDGIDYWVPVKVNNNYVEIQNKGGKVWNNNFYFSDYYVKIKIGNEYYYLDKAEYNEDTKTFSALSWTKKKYDWTDPNNVWNATLDETNKKRAIDDMSANKTT